MQTPRTIDRMNAATEPQIESGDEIVAQENSALQIHRSN
jgi:hypothetical protein